MERILEPEVMDISERALAYAEADFAEVNDAFLERLCALAEGMGECSVLDLGCGPGDVLRRMVERQPGWRAVGVDASPPMLELAAAGAAKACMDTPIRLVLCDALQSPFTAASFDVVCSNSLLHHLRQPDGLWKEIRRVGKSGALVFLRDLRRPDNEGAARSIVRQYAKEESSLLREDFYNSLLAAFTAGEVRTQLDEAGLRAFDVLATSDRHLDVVGWIH